MIESRVDLTRSHVRRGGKGRERGERRTRCNSQEGKGIKGTGNQNGELRVCKPGGSCNRCGLRDAGRTWFALMC